MTRLVAALTHGLVAATVLFVTSGCHHPFEPSQLWSNFGQPMTPPTGGPVAAPPMMTNAQAGNPMRITGVAPEFFWNQLVDTVDDYFSIESERRVQVVGGVLTEGQIETHYQPGATVLEPWLWDSSSHYELALATLQSIRRRASIRVVPVAGGYDVYATVYKELEDVNLPAQATPGSSVPRHDFPLARTDRYTRDLQTTLGWIPQGRDASLEQELLSELYGRVYSSNGR